jgi:hypothetical protein
MKKSKAFILLSSLLLLVVFSYLSTSIIQNLSYSSKINQLKYNELQALIHIKYIKKQLSKNIPINSIDLNDSRYNIDIIKFNSKNSTKFDIYISSKITHISIYDNLRIPLSLD